jgi:aminocarboxymuconate-semialdehyde decarboxylase
LKLDVFNHVYPKAYFERIRDHGLVGRIYGVPALVDLDARFRLMDRFGDYAQVICLSGPPLENLPQPEALSRLANDGMAAMVSKHPERFPGFVASLPMNAPDAMLREAERAVRELGALGVQAYSQVAGRPLTAPPTQPLFGLMEKLDRPIWLHPERDVHQPDYEAEERSHYEIWFALGWPHETSVAMAQIALSGVFDRHPKLKVIAHQMGGTIPYLATRVENVFARFGMRSGVAEDVVARAALRKKPIEYFRMFYTDTTSGNVDAARCALSFFGAGRMLFASDAPFGPEGGAAYIGAAIRAVEELPLSPEQRSAVFEGNARKLLPLTSRKVHEHHRN